MSHPPTYLLPMLLLLLPHILFPIPFPLNISSYSKFGYDIKEVMVQEDILVVVHCSSYYSFQWILANCTSTIMVSITMRQTCTLVARGCKAKYMYTVRGHLLLDFEPCSKCLTLSGATEQFCAAGSILKPLCLSKQFTHCSQHI